MCTVTWINTEKGWLLTSNRDEHILRANADFPVCEEINNQKIYYAKDSIAGGSWFFVNESGDVIVLLNGGFNIHMRKESYRKSRGVVLKEFMASGDELNLDFWKEYDLNNIEPFTLVCFISGNLWELVWDGEQLHISPKESSQNHIWCSSTLYDLVLKAQRKNLFYQSSQLGLIKTGADIKNLHTTRFLFESQSELTKEIKTVSITQLEITSESVDVMYEELNDPLHGERHLIINKKK